MRPATGRGFALVLPEATTATLQAFLDGFAAQLAPDGHAAMLPDRAGRHGARSLVAPGNVALAPLPPCGPQSDPVERVRPHLRERHLSRRLLHGHGAVVDARCAAWNQLTPERLRSLTSHPYPQQVNG